MHKLVAEPGPQLISETRITLSTPNHLQEGAELHLGPRSKLAEEEGFQAEARQIGQLLETSQLGVRKARTPRVCGLWFVAVSLIIG